jgi:hypothetical protein
VIRYRGSDLVREILELVRGLHYAKCCVRHRRDKHNRKSQIPLFCRYVGNERRDTQKKIEYGWTWITPEERNRPKTCIAVHNLAAHLAQSKGFRESHAPRAFRLVVWAFRHRRWLVQICGFSLWRALRGIFPIRMELHKRRLRLYSTQ